MTQVLAGLSYAHTLQDFDGTPLGIVHRDVSPSNVFVTTQGDVKLLDFGIAKAAGAVSFTRQGIVKGKIGYAAPEQCPRPTLGCAQRHLRRGRDAVGGDRDATPHASRYAARGAARPSRR